MDKSRICIFQISYNTPNLVDALNSLGIDTKQPNWRIISVETASGDHPLPNVGYRLAESNELGHTRPGPWVVSKAPQRFAATQKQTYNAAFIFECEYRPLENPGDWISPIKAQVPAHVAEEIGMKSPATV